MVVVDDDDGCEGGEAGGGGEGGGGLSGDYSRVVECVLSPRPAGRDPVMAQSGPGSGERHTALQY